MIEDGWILLNGLVGVPLALTCLVVGRELFRSLVGIALGFRVFEMGWGIGRPILALPLGPIDFSLRALPLAGTTIAASGSPRHHRAARLAMASGPLLLQIAWLVFAETKTSTLLGAATAGPAPWAIFAVANAGLVALHLLIPFETRSGVRSDVRMLIDFSFGRADSDRSERARYYARLARHRLERANVAGAAAALEQGLIQLGREPLLVACEAELSAADLSSVIDQGSCADALRDHIDRAELRRTPHGASPSIGAQLRRAAITALPLGLATLVLVAVGSSRLAQSMHDRWLGQSDEILAAGDANRCASWIERGSSGIRSLARILPDDPERRRDRHQRLARLERCRGGLEPAAEHLAVAIAAAESMRAAHDAMSQPDPEAWLSSELVFATLLCDDARLESERRVFREALASLARADSSLELARNRVTAWSDPASRDRATQRVQAIAEEIAATRAAVLARMTIH